MEVRRWFIGWDWRAVLWINVLPDNKLRIFHFYFKVDYYFSQGGNGGAFKRIVAQLIYRKSSLCISPEYFETGSPKGEVLRINGLINK